MSSMAGLMSELDFRESTERLFGVYAAVVRQADDPENKGRIRVACSAIASDYLSDWIQVVQADAGSDHGAYFIPEQDDQVIIAFLNGIPRTPIVLGSIYSATKMPVMARSATSVPRYFVTPGGHMIVMEDKTGRRIEIVDGTGSNSVLIDTEKNTIKIKASADVEIDAGANLKLSASGNVTISASGSVDVSGTTINLN